VKERVRGDYKDWAKLGKANQSSTYDNNVASNAISGNLDMYTRQKHRGAMYRQIYLSLSVL
jgi:hypothetical protein